MNRNNPQSELNTFVKARNVSILFFFVIVIASFIFFRNSMSQPIYVEPQEGGLLLSCYKKDEYVVPYDRIESTELVDTFDFGTMLEGTDDSRVRSGTWENETFGTYRLYTQKSVSHYIILKTADSAVVFNYESNDVTDSIYNGLEELLP